MLAFSVSEYEARVQKTCESMEKAGIDALLVTRPENIYYLSGYRSVGHGIAKLHVLVVGRDGDLRILARMLERQTVLNYTWTKDPVFYRDFDDPYQLLKEILGEMKISRKRIGLEKDTAYMSLHKFHKLQQVFPRAVFKDASGLVEALRMIKSEQEIKYMRRAGELTDIGIQAGIDATEIGVHEYEVVAAILRALYENGQDDLLSSYYTVNSGPTGGFAHDSYRERVIEKNDAVFIELGGCHHLYTTNAIVTLFMGSPPQGLTEIHKTTVKLYTECVNACKPGASAEDVWKVADRIYRDAGLGNYYRRVGFSVGISAQPNYWISEGFDIAKGEKRKLKPGMTLSIEPGAGSFGIATKKENPLGTLIGADILVTETEPEQLSTPRLEIISKS